MLVRETQASEPLFPYYELISSFHLKSEGKKCIHMNISCFVDQLPKSFLPTQKT